MITLRVVFALGSVSLLLAGHNFWAASPTRAHAAGIGLEWRSPLDPRDRMGVPLEPHHWPTRDQWGNDIERAVGDYRVDPRGGMYERHSPETEVPRLESPIM